MGGIKRWEDLLFQLEGCGFTSFVELVVEAYVRAGSQDERSTSDFRS